MQAVNLMLYTSQKLASTHALKEEFFAAMQSKTRLETLSALTTWISHALNVMLLVIVILIDSEIVFFIWIMQKVGRGSFYSFYLP